MAWAISGQISQAQIEGGIEISDEQYAEALNAMLEGKLIVVEDGAMTIVEPTPPEPSPAERRVMCLAAIRDQLTAKNDAVLSPGRRQLAMIDAGRIRRKAIEERSDAENSRLSDIDRDQEKFYELERHAVILSIELEDLAEADLAEWAPHSWPEV